MRPFVPLIVFAMLLALAFAATPSARPVAAQGESITIADFAFDPDTLTITVGTEVTWINEDSATHTVTSDVGDFDSGPLENGDSIAFTFNEPGTYAYHCDFHPGMTATIEVVAAQGTNEEATEEPAEEEPAEEEATEEAAEEEATAAPDEEEAPAEPTGDETTIGTAPDGRSAFEVVGKIEQRGLDFTYYGYFTHIEGIGDDALFTEDNPTERTESTARFTFFGSGQATSRAVVDDALVAVSSEGTLTFYFNDAGGAQFDAAEGFRGGTAIAESTVRFHHVVSLPAPELGLTDGVGDLRQESAEAFTVDGGTYRFGDSGLWHRLSLTGIGTFTDPAEPVATINVAGDGVTTTGGTASTAPAAEPAAEETDETAAADGLIIELRELDGSGFSGEALLTPSDAGTDVTIALSGPTGDNPVHIHSGTCDELDPNPLFPLPDIAEDGSSALTVEVPLDSLLGDRFAINVHKSATEIGIYVACGEIAA